MKLLRTRTEGTPTNIDNGYDNNGRCALPILLRIYLPRSIRLPRRIHLPSAPRLLHPLSNPAHARPGTTGNRNRSVEIVPICSSGYLVAPAMLSPNSLSGAGVGGAASYCRLRRKPRSCTRRRSSATRDGRIALALAPRISSVCARSRVGDTPPAISSTSPWSDGIRNAIRPTLKSRLRRNSKGPT